MKEEAQKQADPYEYTSFCNLLGNTTNTHVEPEISKNNNRAFFAQYAAIFCLIGGATLFGVKAGTKDELSADSTLWTVGALLIVCALAAVIAKHYFSKTARSFEEGGRHNYSSEPSSPARQ